MLHVYFDGGYSQTRGGVATYGFVVKNDEFDVIYEGCGRVGRGPDMTCNVGEYEGLYHAMVYIDRHFPDAHVIFHGDSNLVISQMKGEAQARKGKYIPYYEKTLKFAQKYIHNKQWTFRWIQRALNSEADDLAQCYRL